MKKIIPAILAVMIVAACNNAADRVESKDSTNIDVNTKSKMNTDTSRDTSSYERMPNKINDSLQR